MVTAEAHQKDNFPEVIMKIQNGPIVKIPNGETVQILEKLGIDTQVQWGTHVGTVKSENLRNVSEAQDQNVSEGQEIAATKDEEKKTTEEKVKEAADLKAQEEKRKAEEREQAENEMSRAIEALTATIKRAKEVGVDQKNMMQVTKNLAQLLVDASNQSGIEAEELHNFIKKASVAKDDPIPNTLIEQALVVKDGRTPRAETPWPSEVPPLLTIENGLIVLWRGDITTLKVDAIVNAANNGLWVGGGICGAIHKAAGPQLEMECQKIGRCETGQTVATEGCDLPAKFVLHTVGPMTEDHEMLRSSYATTLDVAAQKGIRSVALCCVSTGIFGFPLKPATEIAINTVKKWLDSHVGVMQCVIFTVFQQQEEDIYKELLSHYF